jgi:hypothetical protein
MGQSDWSCEPSSRQRVLVLDLPILRECIPDASRPASRGRLEAGPVLDPLHVARREEAPAVHVPEEEP